EKTPEYAGDIASIRIAFDVATLLNISGEATIYHVLLVNLLNGILDIHLIPVARNGQPLCPFPGRLPDKSSHSGIRYFRCQIRVTGGNDGNPVARIILLGIH